MHLLLLSVVCFNFAPLINAGCSNAEYGRICTLQAPNGSPVTSEIIDERLLVGTTSSLQVFNLRPYLQQAERVDLSSGNDIVEKCSGFEDGQLGESIEDCKNFIRTIQHFPNPNGDQQQVLVCGTNAHFPECNVHQVDRPSIYRKLTIENQTDPGYSPDSKTHRIEARLASNGKFFTATRFGDNDFIRMSPGALQNDTSFTVGTSQDDRWLNTPSFISVHEYGDHIFFFMSEPALELEGVQEVRYSRAVSICKTDAGISDTDTDPRTNHFLTFQKARIVCKVDKGGGSITFFYDELASTFLNEAEGVLYGVFNSPANGPSGGAICKFTFDTINGVFEDRNFLRRMSREDGSVFWGRSVAPDSFSCPGSPTGEQRSPAEIMIHQLKDDIITPTESLPLFVSTSAFLDKVAAEMVTYMGDDQEILYYTDIHGSINQVVLSASTHQRYRHTIYEPDSPNPVKDLFLQHMGNKRSLIASSSGQIIQIPRGECSNYTDCFSCFDSKDAYCGWDPNINTCRNKFEHSNIATLIQVFSATETSIITECGTRTIVPTEEPVLPCSQTPSTDPSTEITSKTEREEDTDGKDCTTKTATGKDPETEGLSGGNGESVSIGIPVVVGASVGAFLFGLSIGSVICIIFIASKSREKGSSPESQRENAAHQPSTRNETIQANNNQINEKEKLERIGELKPAPPPRYIQHNPSGSQQPVADLPTVMKTMPSNGTLGSTTSLPPMYAKHSNGTINRHQLPEFFMGEDGDSAFADQDKDTLPPLKTFPSTGSLGRSKPGTSRRQKAQRGRTDSTTRLITRQRSESLSSDISSSTSPLQSPISDV